MNYKYVNCTPYPHQEEILNKSFEHNNLGMLWEMGTGKTLGLINILRYRYGTNKRLMKTLIVTPLITLYNWQEEILKFSNIDKKDIVILDCNGHKRTKKFIDATMNKQTKALDKAKIVIVNYESVQTDKLYEAFREWGAEIIVADESHKLKNPKSKRAKRVVKLADSAIHRYILTGTPILNKVSDLFHQYRFLDGGKTFGKNFFVFQNKYMCDVNAGWASKLGYFPKWEARPETFGILQDKIYSISTRITKEECLKDLPPLVKTVRHIVMAPDQAKAYHQMEKEFIAFVNDNKDQPKAVVAQLAITKALRLQQIVSGYVMTDEGEEINLKKNPKIEATQELLEEVTPNHKVIIWCSFKNNYKQLAKLCDKMKIPYVMITGQQSMKEKKEAMDEFRNNGAVRVVIANRKAAGIGINLVEASYSIVFSRNFSLEDELQSEARNYRGGSQIHDSITKIDLVTLNTVDEVVLAALQSKKSISDAVIDFATERR